MIPFHSLAACGGGGGGAASTGTPGSAAPQDSSAPAGELTATQQIIQEAEGMTLEEAQRESARCLRCDHFGYGVFKGGREEKW